MCSIIPPPAPLLIMLVGPLFLLLTTSSFFSTSCSPAPSSFCLNSCCPPLQFGIYLPDSPCRVFVKDQTQPDGRKEIKDDEEEEQEEEQEEQDQEEQEEQEEQEQEEEQEITRETNEEEKISQIRKNCNLYLCNLILIRTFKTLTHLYKIRDISRIECKLTQTDYENHNLF